MHVLTVLCNDDWMSDNLVEGWRCVGCEVEEFFYGNSLGKSWNKAGLRENKNINHRLLNKARMLKSQGRLDLIFASIYDDKLCVDTAKQLRELCVPMVNYHVDLVSQWYRVLKTGKYFDLVACAQREHFAGLKRANIRPYYMPMAANPPIQDQQISKQEHIFNGVLFLGSPWQYRQIIFKKLIENGIDLRIYGHNWWMTQKNITDYVSYLNKSLTARLRESFDNSRLRKNIHDLFYYLVPLLLEEGKDKFMEIYNNKFVNKNITLSDNDYELINSLYKGIYLKQDFHSLVNGAAINLSFTHLFGEPSKKNERRQVRLREFEIPASGGFILTQDCSQLRELYEVGKNIIVWDNISDLYEKIEYYLNNSTERKKIAEASRAHCLENHTWQNRFSKLLIDLNISQPHL